MGGIALKVVSNFTGAAKAVFKMRFVSLFAYVREKEKVPNELSKLLSRERRVT